MWKFISECVYVCVGVWCSMQNLTVIFYPLGVYVLKPAFLFHILNE